MIGVNVMDVQVGKIYRHFKGNLYLIEGIAIHSETGEKMVVYRGIYDDCPLYVRPLSMFTEKLDKDAYPGYKQEYRFQRVEVTTSIKDEIH